MMAHQPAPELTNDLIGRILSFGVNHSDRLSLALTCTSMRQGVENHSENGLQMLRQKHNLMDNVEFQRLMFNELHRNHQQFPFRCQLWAAMRVPLYQFTSDVVVEAAATAEARGDDEDSTIREYIIRECNESFGVQVISFVLSPTQDRIAVRSRVITQISHASFLDVWDLSTKERVLDNMPTLFEGEDDVHKYLEWYVLPVDDSLVACAFGRYKMYFGRCSKTEDGDWHVDFVLNASLNHGGFNTFVTYKENELLFTLRHEDWRVAEKMFYINSLDLCTGAVRQIGSFQTVTHMGFSAVYLAVCDSNWLAILTVGRQFPQESRIDVFEMGRDGDEFHLFCTCKDDFDDHPLVQSSPGSKTLYCLKGGCVCVLDLKDTGELVERRLRYSIRAKRIVGVSQTRLVVLDSDVGTSNFFHSCTIYNVVTGERLRSWHCPMGRVYHGAVVSSKRKELLIVSSSKSGIMVEAFCLGDYL